MKLCDNNWGNPSGGHSVECWESKQPNHLALKIECEHYQEFDYRHPGYQTATLDADACLALGLKLVRFAEEHGATIPQI